MAGRGRAAVAATRTNQGAPRRAMRALAALAGAIALAACSAQGQMAGLPGTNVARAALNGGSPQVALNVTERILASNPNDAESHIIQGEAFTALGQTANAEAAFTTALKLDPGSAEADVGLGRLILGTDPAKAEALFLQALDVQPRDAVAMNDLGIARDLQGRHTQAQEAYRKALGVDPTMEAAQVNLALSLAMSGRGDQAVAMLRGRAEAPGATEQMRHDLAAAMVMAGDRAGAERILSQDLPPDQVARAIAAFELAGGHPMDSGTASPVSAGTPTRLQPMPAPRPVAQPAVPKAVPPAPQVAQASAVPPAAKPAPAAAVPGTPAAQSGPEVQLSAAASSDAAQALWTKLSRQMPDLFANRTPMIREAQVNGAQVWRLRVSGFASVGDAIGFCASLHAHGVGCTAYND